MNLQETLALIEALRLAGVTKFKSLEHDIILEAPLTTSGNQLSPKKTVEPVETPIAENKEATEKLKDLISTLKMSDEELLNQIMPDGAL